MISLDRLAKASLIKFCCWICCWLVDTCFGCFREDLQLVQFGMVWFGMVWYGLVWLETTSIQSYYENFIKIQLVLAVLEKIYSRFGLVWYGMVWYGMVWSGWRQHPSKVTMKISSK